MFRAENLKRYKGKSSDCGTQSGLFLLYLFSSDSSALHISFFSGNPVHSLLRRNSSAGKDAQDPYGGGEHPGRRGEGKCLRGEMCIRGRVWHPGRSGKQVVTEVRCLVKVWWCTLEGGGKRRLRGEMLMRGREWYPGKWGEASRPEVSRRPEVKGGTPEIGKREECQR